MLYFQYLEEKRQKSDFSTKWLKIKNMPLYAYIILIYIFRNKNNTYGNWNF